MSFNSFWNTYIIPQRTKENPAPGAFTLVPGEKIDKLWDEYTGKAAIDQQNQWQLQLAKYQSQAQEEFYNKYSSPAALMRQYQEAGLNPNLVYGNAAAGQSNVPSFQAPNVQRNMSGSDQLAKGLSMIGQLLGIKQMIYQTDAAREASEQAGIKTLNDLTLSRRNLLDYMLEANVQGYFPSLGFRNRYRRSAIGRLQGEVLTSMSELLPAYSQYYQSVREGRMNDILKKSMQNVFDYGRYYGDGRFIEQNLGTVPYYLTRNRQSYFNYDWDYEYKSYLKAAGIASPIIQTLIRLFGGK